MTADNNEDSEPKSHQDRRPWEQERDLAKERFKRGCQGLVEGSAEALRDRLKLEAQRNPNWSADECAANEQAVTEALKLVLHKELNKLHDKHLAEMLELGKLYGFPDVDRSR